MRGSATATRRRFLQVATHSLVGTVLNCATPAALATRDFTFAVVTDLHYRDARCDGWFEQVVRHLQALRPRPAFIVLGGDLSEDGNPEQLAAIRGHFARMAQSVHAVLGNHDYTEAGSRAAYEATYGSRLNYRFRHGGVEFLVLDTTEARKVYRTRIPEATLAWAAGAAQEIPSERPLVLLTHFPLGRNWLRPLNSGALLKSFRRHQVLGAFSGHWHGLTERREGALTLSTGRCCSWWRTNHDGSDEKGYTLVRIQQTEGLLPAAEHRFVPVT